MHKILFVRNRLLFRICPHFQVKNQKLLFGDTNGLHPRDKSKVETRYWA